MSSLSRRDFLAAGTVAAAGALLTSRIAFARAETNTRSRFVLIILRGAVDGLSAVPPYGDRDYAGLRRELALWAPGTAGGVLPLNDLFGLHPAFAFLQEAYTARELIVFHAIASPYRERSHFDGQDVLEGGYLRPHSMQTGWLNRALASIPARPAAERELGVSLGQNVPLVMRGPAAVTSWSPSRMAALDEETLERIADLYSGDPLLASRLADALAAEAIAEGQNAGAMASANGPGGGAVAASAGSNARAMAAGPDASGGPQAPDARARRDKPGSRYAEVIHAAAGFLSREDGPQVAVFDTTGWDTHANEGGAEGQLAGKFGALDAALRTLKSELGPTWNHTAVLLATEFGRTAAVNGTRGTDHGTGTVAFLLGGAVAGGRVIADWPGLSGRALYQGRDLKPTLDLRSVFKGVLAEHLLIPVRALDVSVFPDSRGAKSMAGLIKS